MELDVERCGDHSAPLPCAECDRRELLDEIGLGVSLAISFSLLVWIIVAALITRFGQ
jgi:hypothetical protein